VAFELLDPRVLVCGSRRWPWRGTVEAVLDRLAARHGEQLVVIEGGARGRIMRRTCGANVMDFPKIATGVTRWLSLDLFPPQQAGRIRREPHAWLPHKAGQ
jgi:hypothetical protein